MAQVLTVTFANSYTTKTYDYYSGEPDVEANDLAIVNSPNSGWTLVTIVGVREAVLGDDDKHKPVLQVASLSAERNRVKNEALAKIIKAKLAKLEAKRTDAERYSALAAADPEAAKLLEQLKILEI